MPQDTQCLYSTVKNKTGKVRKFGFLPPHGRELGVDEDFTVFGDIKQALIRFDRGESRRSILAFEAALKNNDIEILSTPAPVLVDKNAPHTTKMIEMRGGTLGVVDPCWNTTVSANPAADG